MTHSNNLSTPTNHPISLGKLMLIGAAVGFAVIAVFVFGVRHPNPEWGQYWMIRPLIITPLAGATGGVFFYMMDYFRTQGGRKKVAANVVSFLVCMIGLWMGVILGLAGTMWH